MTNLVTPELEVLEVFEWKNLKMISIQCMESYDKVGRFAAEEGQLNNAWDFLTPLVSLSDGFHQRTRLSIDNLHFTKQLTALVELSQAEILNQYSWKDHTQPTTHNYNRTQNHN